MYRLIGCIILLIGLLLLQVSADFYIIENGNSENINKLLEMSYYKIIQSNIGFSYFCYFLTLMFTVIGFLMSSGFLDNILEKYFKLILWIY